MVIVVVVVVVVVGGGAGGGGGSSSTQLRSTGCEILFHVATYSSITITNVYIIVIFPVLTGVPYVVFTLVFIIYSNHFVLCIYSHQYSYSSKKGTMERLLTNTPHSRHVPYNTTVDTPTAIPVDSIYLLLLNSAQPPNSGQRTIHTHQTILSNRNAPL